MGRRDRCRKSTRRLDLPPLDVHEKGRLLVKGSAHVAAEVARVELGLGVGERVAGVEHVVAVADEGCPWKVSLPGFVKTSMRPNPRRSYSEENGFWLMRTSRIEDFGGSLPFENPSMKSGLR